MHFHDGIAHDHHHDHGDHHTHENIKAFDNAQQAEALVSYMLDHNKHHAEELHEVSHRLEAGGQQVSADLIAKAVAAFTEGNNVLADALQALKEGK